MVNRNNGTLFVPNSTGTIAITSDIPDAQVNSDWNASSGVAEILNTPSIPEIDNKTIINDALGKIATQIGGYKATQTSTIYSHNMPWGFYEGQYNQYMCSVSEGTISEFDVEDDFY